MVVAAVDTNKKDLKMLVKYLRLSFSECEVVMFGDPKEAARYLLDNPIDVLYTEVNMPGMTGFGLQEAVEAVQPAVLTVFVTSTEVHAAHAIKTRATGYVLKPVTREKIQESLNETKFSITNARI